MQLNPHAFVRTVEVRNRVVRAALLRPWFSELAQGSVSSVRFFTPQHRIVNSTRCGITIATARRTASSSLLNLHDEDALVNALLRGDTVKRSEESQPALTQHNNDTLALQRSGLRSVPPHRAVTPSFIPNENHVDVTESRVANALATPFMHTRRQLLRVAKQNKFGAARFDPRGVEWMCCRCETYNFVGRRSCRRCHADESESYKVNFPPTRHVPLLPHTWQCERCTHTNSVPSRANTAQSRAKFLCSSCSAPFPGVREWYCPECDHVNSPAATQCATCFVERRPSWVCVSCGESKNSVFLTQCRQCGEKRTTLVSDSTALCSVCNQRNDVQWELCFSCMAPLPLLFRTHDAQQVIARAAVQVPEASSSIRASAELEEQVELFTADGDTNAEGSAVNPATEASVPDSSHEKRRAPRREDPVNSPSVDRKRNDASSVQKVVDPDLVGLEIGSWKCYHCDVLQRRNASFCDICLQPRTACGQPPVSSSGETAQDAHRTPPTTSDLNPVAPEPERSRTAPASPGSWTCPRCRRERSAQAQTCCDTPRAMSIGYWQCPECSSINREERQNCLGCQLPRPLRQWWCSDCNAQNGVNSFSCLRCGTAHPSKWKCPECATVVEVNHASCPSCETERPTALKQGTKKTCPRCHTDNAEVRKVCYRCNTDLGSRNWDCAKCGAKENKPTALRCGECGTPRPHNESEFVWLCEVCEEGIRCRDDLAYLNYCPCCNSPRTPTCVEIPARWKCDCCEVYNEYFYDKCRECGHRRCLHGMKTNVTCPVCFAATELKEDERCGSCHASLSVLVDNLGKQSFRTLSSASATMDLPMGYSMKAPMDIASTIASPSSQQEETVPSKVKPARAEGLRTQNLKSSTDVNLSHPRSAAFGESNLMQSDGRAEKKPSPLPTQGANVPNTGPHVHLAHHTAFAAIGVDTEADEEPRDAASEYDESDGDENDDDNGVDRLENIEIPSWTCTMCETENLSDEPRCVECGLVRADTSHEVE